MIKECTSLDQEHSKSTAVEVHLALELTLFPVLLSLSKDFVELALVVVLSERSLDVVETEAFGKVLFERRVVVEGGRFRSLGSWSQIRTVWLSREDRDVQVGQFPSVLGSHASPAVLAPHEEAAVAEKPHPEFNWNLVECSRKLVYPTNDVEDRDLDYVEDQDDDVRDGLEPEKGCVKNIIQE